MSTSIAIASAPTSNTSGHCSVNSSWDAGDLSMQPHTSTQLSIHSAKGLTENPPSNVSDAGAQPFKPILHAPDSGAMFSQTSTNTNATSQHTGTPSVTRHSSTTSDALKTVRVTESSSFSYPITRHQSVQVATQDCPYKPGQHVHVFSMSKKRWYNDAFVREIDKDGRCRVIYNRMSVDDNDDSNRNSSNYLEKWIRPGDFDRLLRPNAEVDNGVIASE